ncbi:hypothetical protein JXA80_07890 [bacterium]|nr:hypothetical protein [candidate division CSSED10-310 bacterium]
MATQSTIIAFGVNLFLTFYVLIKLRGWNRALNRNFAVLSFAFALWNLGVATRTSTLVYTGVFMAPAAFYTFLVTLLRQFNHRTRLLSLYLTISSVVLIAMSIWLINQPTSPAMTYPLLNVLVFSMAMPVFAWGAIRVGNRVRLTRSNRERSRLAYVLTGLTAAGIAGAAAGLSALGYPLQSWTSIAGLFYTVSITIAIMRHRLFDVGRFAGRLVVIVIVALVFWLLFGVLGHFYMDVSPVSFLAIFVAAIVLVALYEPLKSLVEGPAYRVLSPDVGEFLNSLDAFAREMNTYLDEPAMIRGLARTLRTSNRIASFAIYTVDPTEQSLILQDGDDIRRQPGSLIPFPEPLIETMMMRRGPVSQNQVSVELRGGLPRPLRDRQLQLYRVLNRLRASETFPFIFGDRFFGFVSVGLEDPESDLTRSEEDMLTAIARQFAAALAHTRLEARARTREHLVALGRLASGLAHEIRNPLATIKASVQYLEPVIRDSDSAEFFDIINEEVGRLDRFLERFLHYARPGSQSNEGEMQPLSDFLVRMIKVYEARSECESIDIRLSVDDAAAARLVPVDPCHQIFTNLFSNAIQAMPGGGTLTITARIIDDSGMLEVAVDDSGPGIPDDDLGQIFEPFFTRRDGGTGLGLAIVRRLVRQLHGDIIYAQSHRGGACFLVRLPHSSTRG